MEDILNCLLFLSAAILPNMTADWPLQWHPAHGISDSSRRFSNVNFSCLFYCDAAKRGPADAFTAAAGPAPLVSPLFQVAAPRASAYRSETALDFAAPNGDIPPGARTPAAPNDGAGNGQFDRPRRRGRRHGPRRRARPSPLCSISSIARRRRAYSTPCSPRRPPERVIASGFDQPARGWARPSA